MNILIVSDAWHPQINGVVTTYEFLINELKANGDQVTVISPSDFKHVISMPGYSEIKLAIAPYKALKNHIAKVNPDYIHIATEGPLGWAARKYCVQHDFEFTTSYHTHFPDYVAKRLPKFLQCLYRPTHALAKSLIKTFHRPAKFIFIATESLGEDLKKWGFSSPLRMLTRGVDTSLFYPGEETLFSDLPKPLALYVGRISVEKNIEEFLKMEWRGSKIIVGEGPKSEEFKRKYPAAHFLGKKTGAKLAQCYRACDIFVFPSKTDTFGIVIIEALASGLPVAGYTVTGPIDIITAPELGALDKNNLSSAAHQALKNGDPNTCVQHVKQYYSWAHAAQQFTNTVIE